MGPKVIVSGFLRDGLGLAEISRGYAVALAAGGCEVWQHMVRLPGRPFPHGDPGPEGILPFPEAEPDAEADLVIVCLCPPELDVIRRERIMLPAGRINAGLWIWDVDPIPPAWAQTAHRFDEIWSPSSYVTGLLQRSVVTPVYTVPPGLRTPCGGGQSEYLDPERPTVVVLADVASSLERKNPLGAIEAFKRAFAPDQGPRLVVKIWNGAADPEGWSRLEGLAGVRPDIVLVDRWISRPDLVSLLQGAWCFLSLHRAEGFGLPIFEALAVGTPVIATAFSGPMDFLDETVALLVPAVDTLVPDGVPAYPAGSIWAEPDLDAAAEALRFLWENPDEARTRTERGRRLVAERLAPDVVGPVIAAHLVERLQGLELIRPKPGLRPTVSVVTQLPVEAAGTSDIDRLQRLAQAARQFGGEVVVGTAGPVTFPDGAGLAGVRSVNAGRGGDAALRAAALREADGDFIVLIGDRYLPRQGWWEGYEEAFEQTGADVLYGPPSRHGPSTDNCALRAAVVDRPTIRPGRLEQETLPRLALERRCAYVPAAGVEAVIKASPIRSYAQMAEDVRLARAFRGQRSGFYIDIGAGHPVLDSVTKHFYDMGWSGVNVEPDARLAEALRRERGRDVVVEAVCSDCTGKIEIYETGVGEGWSTVEHSAVTTVRSLLHADMSSHMVDSRSLADICAEYVTGRIDFLKIDAEGHEYHVIKGADWDRWRPRVVLVEATEPHSTRPSHATWEPLLIEAGYLRAGFDGINRFYVPVEEQYLVDVLEPPVTALDDFETHRQWQALEELAEARQKIARLEGDNAALAAELARVRAGNGSPGPFALARRAAQVARRSWGRWSRRTR